MKRRIIILGVILSILIAFIFTDKFFHKEAVTYYNKVSHLLGIDEFKEDNARSKARPFNERAADYIEAGEYESAITEAKKAIEIYPTYAWAHTNLGAAYYQLGQYDLALKEYKIALKYKPDFFSALNNLAIIYNNKGEYDRAIEIYAKIMKLEPNERKVHKNLGITYLNKSLFDLAEAEFDKARQLEKGDAELLNNGKWKERVEVFRKRIKDNHCDARANYLLGQICYDSENYDLAIYSYEKAISDNSCYEGNDYHLYSSYNNLGASYLQKGRVDEAIVNFQKAIQENPHSCKSYYGLGVALWRMGKYEEAVSVFMKLLQYEPNHALSRYLLGVCKERQKDYDKAIEEYKKGMDLAQSPDKQDVKGYLSLGLARCYFAKRDKGNTLKYLDVFRECFSYLNVNRTGGLFFGLFDVISEVKKISPNCNDEKCLRIEIKKILKKRLPEYSKLQEAEVNNVSEKGSRFLGLGAIYLEFGLTDEAIKLLATARNYNCSYSEVSYALGLAYLQKGLIKEAINEFYKAILTDYEYPPFRNLIDKIYISAFLQEG